MTTEVRLQTLHTIRKKRIDIIMVKMQAARREEEARERTLCKLQAQLDQARVDVQIRLNQAIARRQTYGDASVGLAYVAHVWRATQAALQMRAAAVSVAETSLKLARAKVQDLAAEYACARRKADAIDNIVQAHAQVAAREQLKRKDEHLFEVGVQRRFVGRHDG